MPEAKNYFKELSEIKCETQKKNNQNYISWAEAWAKVKENYQKSTYVVAENSEGFPYFESEAGAMVKVGVKINAINHEVWLPVMDYNNQAMKKEEYKVQMGQKELTVKAYTTFDINKAIQRAFTKAIAMHGLGLYVYKGEDLPSEGSKKVLNKENTYSKDDIEEESVEDVDPLVCAECNAAIKENVSEYSIKMYGKPLCFTCQEVEKKKNEGSN